MNTKCGYVSIVGRPNVGKSTLLNHLIAQKVAITSRKPQTTRHQQLGIKTENNAQIIFVDTPGLHKVEKRVINRYMKNKNLFDSKLKKILSTFGTIINVRNEDQINFATSVFGSGPAFIAYIVNIFLKASKNPSYFPAD